MTLDELYAKWPVLRGLVIPESHSCCWGCRSQYVADQAGWPAANDWEDAMWGHDDL